MATEQMNTAQTSPDVKIPEDALIIIPVREMVLFPGAIAPIAIARPKSVAAAQQALREQRPIGIVLQRSPETEEPGPDDLYRVATIANIVRYITAPDGTHHIVCQGVQRARILDFLPGTPFPAARIQQIPEPTTSSPEIEARALNLQRQAIEAIELLPQAPPELVAMFQSTTAPGALADLATSFMDIKPQDKQEVLETIDLALRVEKVSKHLAERLEVLRISNEIGQKTKASFDERQREAILREQMATIQRQLGEGDGKAAEVAELTAAIAKANMPPEADAHAKKELRRYERMPEAAGESGHGPHVSRLADRAAMGAARGEADRHQGSAPHPGCRSFRPGEDQEPDHRISGRAQARAARQGADPVLRRPARRRQDLARPVHRARDGSPLRARQPGRRA